MQFAQIGFERFTGAIAGTGEVNSDWDILYYVIANAANTSFRLPKITKLGQRVRVDSLSLVNSSVLTTGGDTIPVALVNFEPGGSVSLISDTLTSWAVIATGDLIGTVQLGGTGGLLGFFGATPIVRPGPYVQTFAAASRTMPNATSLTLTDNTAGTPSITELQAIGVGAVDVACALAADVRNVFATIGAELVKIRADLAAAKQVTNAHTDDLGDTSGLGLLND